MAKINYNTLATADEAGFKKAIDSIHTRADTLALEIHKVLVAIAVQWEKTGDVRPVAGRVNYLLAKDKLTMARKNAIKAWVETYLGLTIVEEGDNKGEFYAKKGLSHKSLEIKELTNNRWWEFKPEPEYKPLASLESELEKLIKRCERDIKELGDGSKVDTTFLTHLKDELSARKAA